MQIIEVGEERKTVTRVARIENVQNVGSDQELVSDVPIRKSEIRRIGCKKSTFGKLKPFQCTSCKRFIHNVCGFVFTSIDEEQNMLECNTQCREISAVTLQLSKKLLEEVSGVLVSQLEEETDVLNEVKDDRIVWTDTKTA
uniref:Uncharacterized protein n=1 Tax=Caenorhabditis japonica TaxID=281687 RepID=A0A8R1IRY1_CAEJA